MKTREEKKSRRLSTRMTQWNYEVIQKTAKECNMSVSDFVVDSCKDSNPQAADAIRKEVAALWLSLK